MNSEDHLAANHERGQVGFAGRVWIGFAGYFALTQHGNAVGNAQHLFELVGNKDNRLALLLKQAHDLKEAVNLLRCQDRSWLVQDENIGVAIECLDNLHPLAHAHGQLFHNGVGVHVQIITVRKFADPPRHRSGV